MLAAPLSRIVLLAVLLSAVPALAQSDIFLQGGALRGNAETTWTYEAGFIAKRSPHFGIGFAYYNEGHLFDNHRDGLTVQGWYIHPLSQEFEVQLGTGPYASMNNTTVDGVRENQFNLGLLSSVALKWRPTGNRWYFRAQYNNGWVPGSFSSNAVLLGMGRDFREQEPEEENGKLDADLSLWGGTSRTTQIGEQDTAIAYEIEAKLPIKNFEHLKYSIGLLSEGDTNLANRKGVPVQLWYDQPVTKRLTLSMGIGPYVAYDSNNDRKVELIAIGSLRATFQLVGRYEVGVMYHRVASFANRDQDIVMLGLLAHL